MQTYQLPDTSQLFFQALIVSMSLLWLVSAVDGGVCVIMRLWAYPGPVAADAQGALSGSLRAGSGVRQRGGPAAVRQRALRRPAPHHGTGQGRHRQLRLQVSLRVCESVCQDMRSYGSVYTSGTESRRNWLAAIWFV